MDLVSGRLAIRGSDGHTIENKVKLGKDYADIADRTGY